MVDAYPLTLPHLSLLSPPFHSIGSPAEHSSPASKPSATAKTPWTSRSFAATKAEVEITFTLPVLGDCPEHLVNGEKHPVISNCDLNVGGFVPLYGRDPRPSQHVVQEEWDTLAGWVPHQPPDGDDDPPLEDPDSMKSTPGKADVHFWLEVAEAGPLPIKSKILTWDSVRHPQLDELSVPSFSSEAGTNVWESLLQQVLKQPATAVESKAFLNLAFNVALGASIDLSATLGNVRAYAVTSSCTEHVVKTFQQIGRVLRQVDEAIATLSGTATQSKGYHKLRARSKRTTKSRLAPNSARGHAAHALAGALSTFLSYLRPAIVSLLPQEQMSLDPLRFSTAVSPILDICGLLTEVCIAPIPTSSGTLLTRLYDALQSSINRGDRHIIQAIAAWLLEESWNESVLAWQSWLGITQNSNDHGQRSQQEEAEDVQWEKQWQDIGIHVIADAEDEDDGIGADLGVGEGYRQPKQRQYKLYTDALPVFLPVHVAEQLFHAGVALRLLRRAVSRPFGRNQRKEKVAWQWTTEEAEHVDIEPAQSPKSWSLSAESFHDFMDVISKPIGSTLTISLGHEEWKSRFICRINSLLQHSHHTLLPTSLPTLSLLTRHSIHKPLQQQALLLGSEMTRFFIVDMELQINLDIMYRFMLLYDPHFVERCKLALFDSSSTESHKGHRQRREVAYSKLEKCPGISKRLVENYDKWPPHGFNLSLALRTVTLDTISNRFDDFIKLNQSVPVSWNDLEDRLSFAIGQDIEDEQDQKCSDAQTIEAFDFLELDFKPRFGLEKMFRSDVMERYKRINNFLFKLIRLRCVLKDIEGTRMETRRAKGKCSSVFGQQDELDHKVTRLIMSCQQCLNGFSGYVWEIAIGVPWSDFMRCIKSLQHHFDDAFDANGVGVPRATDLMLVHEDTLDRIIQRLFLRQRQSSFTKLIHDGIFVIILTLARAIKSWTLSPATTTSMVKSRMEVVDKLIRQQQTCMKRLTRSLDSLNERNADRQQLNTNSSANTMATVLGGEDSRSGGSHEVGFLEALLIRIDGNGYWQDV